MSTDQNDGPLSKLMRGLGLDADLAPIAAVKRIDERPVSLNPECFFKMAPKPDLMTDTGIHHLSEIDISGPRAFDMHYEAHSSAPEDHRVSVIDLNTYDGAPDSEGCSRFIGYGKNKVDALRDLVEQFDDYDERPVRKSRAVGLGHPEQPPETIDDTDVDFDDGLTDDEPR